MLGEILGLAGVVLLLDRRDKKISCSFVMQVNRLAFEGQGFTYSEGGTHKETLHPQRSFWVRLEDKGTKSQLRQVVDCKTNTVIV